MNEPNDTLNTPMMTLIHHMEELVHETDTGSEKSVSSEQILYNSIMITEMSITAFEPSDRNHNHVNNESRESIIGAIINHKIPNSYYNIESWVQLRKSILDYIAMIHTTDYDTIKCIHKGGRKYNYDFDFVFQYSNDITIYHVELKFNAKKIDDAPQFVSPMHPSRFLTQSYESYFYKNYVPLLSEKAQLPIPSEEEYMTQIHGDKPECMLPYQELYYKGCSRSSKYTGYSIAVEFYEAAKKWSKESIEKFMNETDLKIDLLTEYLQETQRNKQYMLFSNNKFILEQVNVDDYEITSVTNKSPNYICHSRTGIKIKVLLRWKNGNGIAYPAFQIS